MEKKMYIHTKEICDINIMERKTKRDKENLLHIKRERTYISVFFLTFVVNEM